jgi:hypothetical protein
LAGRAPASHCARSAAAGANLTAAEAIAADHDASAVLGAGEIRVLRARCTEPVKSRRADLRPTNLAAAPRIVIDNVVPSVEGGRFAAKCVIGEAVAVAADVFIDGHDLLVVEVLWRAGDEKEWRRKPMQLLGNDRWQAAILPEDEREPATGLWDRSSRDVTRLLSDRGETFRIACAGAQRYRAAGALSLPERRFPQPRPSRNSRAAAARGGPTAKLMLPYKLS